MCFYNSSPINGFIPWGNYHEQIIIGLLLLIVTINTVVSLYCFKKNTILNVQGCKYIFQIINYFHGKKLLGVKQENEEVTGSRKQEESFMERF